ncbi:MAG: hypothetical protein Q8N12_05315 [Thermodesulfovibrionales bacterium]|nr:hypothetical protein [Thermodesulfovibrionales bacterium]
MTFIGMSEQGNAFKYAVLSTKVVQVLQNIVKDKQLSEQEKKILGRGAELLERIIEGSTLVEGKEFTDGLSPTQEGLSAYGYALSTMVTLEAIKKVDGFTGFFIKFFDEINGIKEGKGKKKEAEIMIQFFLALGSSFRSDLKKERYYYPTEKHPLLRSASLNAFSTT